MSGPVPALAALALACLAGCFQEIDSSASSSPPAAPTSHTVALMTPAIGFGTPADAGETDDACMATTFHAMAILRAACAACHGGGPGQNLGQPPFDYVLDVGKLLAATSATVKDPMTMQPVRFLVPGDPDHSRLYVRMFKREMPPGDVVGLPVNPNRPTVSDVSVIRQWIAHCLGANESDGQDGADDDSRAPASSDAAAAPAGEADAAAAADRGPPPDARSASAADARSASAADARAAPPEDAAAAPPDVGRPSPDAGAADTMRRRSDGGANGAG